MNVAEALCTVPRVPYLLGAARVRELRDANRELQVIVPMTIQDFIDIGGRHEGDWESFVETEVLGPDVIIGSRPGRWDTVKVTPLGFRPTLAPGRREAEFLVMLSFPTFIYRVDSPVSPVEAEDHP